MQVIVSGVPHHDQEGDGETGDDEREPSMDPVRAERLDQVHPPRLDHGQHVRRHQIAEHERPGVAHVPGLETRDEPSEPDLDDDDGERRPCEDPDPPTDRPDPLAIAGVAQTPVTASVHRASSPDELIGRETHLAALGDAKDKLERTG